MIQVIHKQLRSGALLIAAFSLLALPLLVFPSVSAQTGGTTSDTETETDTPDQTRVQTRIRTAENDAQKEVQQIRDRAENTTRTQAQRQLACQNREQAMNNKINALKTSASNQLNNLNAAFTKLKAYQAENNISVQNYTSLLDTANTRMQTATNEVAALGSVSGNVDCASEDVAVQLGTVKQAGVATKAALGEYRVALHNILVALADATTTQEAQ